MSNVALRSLIVASSLAVAGAACANLLANPGFETNTSGEFGPPNSWTGQAGWAKHSNFLRDGYVAELENNFAYYTPGDLNNGAVVRQSIGDAFLEGWTYNFGSWAQGAQDNVGTVVYQIGYMDGNSFVGLAKEQFSVDNAWKAYAGVTLTVPNGAAYAGRPITVQFGPGSEITGGANTSNLFIDNASLEAVPEPATILAMGAGIAALAARRRRK